MVVCKDMDCGDSCVPTCSDTIGNCSAPFISSSDYGAIYYQVALCCGSSWMEKNGDVFMSIGPLMVWLVGTPILKVIKRAILRCCLAKLCGMMDGDDDGEEEVKAKKLKEGESDKPKPTSIFTTINGIVQLCCAAVACWTYFHRHFDVHEVNSECPESHCRFLIFLATFLYKPFIIPVYQTVTAATEVIQNSYRSSRSYSIRNMIFSVHGCLLVPFMIVIILVFVVPMVFYSLVLLFLFFPAYVAMFLLLAVPASIGAMVLTRNDLRQEARIYSAVNSAYVFILAYVYSTISVSKLYYGCGYRYTFRTLFEDSFSSYTLTSGLAWPSSSSSLAQNTLVVSLVSGFLCSSLDTISRILCYGTKSSSSKNVPTTSSASLPPHTTLEMAIRAANRV